jgi:TonB family protein
MIFCSGAAAANNGSAAVGGRKRGKMSEAWSQWEGHVVNGEFHLQKYLGGSSESAVFLTEHRGAELRPAAIKLIPTNEASKNVYLSRWRVAQKLAHPHLIRLLQHGCCRLGDRDLLFVVMEYAEENLAEIIPERSLTPVEVRELLKPALEALSYLHGRGLVHGHLKPANVLAAGDQVKVSSDGLLVRGEAIEPPGRLSVYDPPEKASGKISPAGDVWSLGMTVAAALTQRPPAGNDQQLTPAGNDQPLSAAKVPVDLPAPFLDIVGGCLRWDPQQRLTIAEIGDRLDGKPSSAPSPAPLSQPKPRQQSQSNPQPQSSRPRPVGPSKTGSPKSLVAPMLIAVLAVTTLLAALGLLRSKPDGADGRPASQPESKQPEPIHRTGSREKPSPSLGRRQTTATLTNTNSSNPAPALSPPPAGADVVHKVLPDVPQRARNTIQGTIRVEIKVQVDSFGNVVGSEVDSRGPSKYFARLATEAAQSWKFAPSNSDAGRGFILRFDFTNTETRTWATQAP